MMTRTSKVPLIAWILLLSLLPTPAWAVYKTWVGNEGDWSVGTNWSPPGVPAGSDEVDINSSLAVVHLDTSFTLTGGEIVVTQGTLVVEPDQTLSSDPGDILVGEDGMLIVGARATVSLEQYSSTLQGLGGEVFVNGGGVLENRGIVTVGHSAGDSSFFHNCGIWDNQSITEVEAGAYFVNSGTVINEQMYGSIIDRGTVINYAKMIDGWQFDIYEGAVFTNYIDAEYTSSHVFSNMGTVHNHGTLTFTANAGNCGILFNECGGSIDGTVTGYEVSECVIWDGGGDGSSWSDPANWSDDSAPSRFANLYIETISGTLVHIDTLVDLGPGSLTIGARDTLVVDSGAVVTNASLITNQGALAVCDGATLRNDPAGVVDYYGRGALNNFGTVTVDSGGLFENSWGAELQNDCGAVVSGTIVGDPPVECVQWDGGGDGSDWFDALNWNGDEVPQEGDFIVIAAGAEVGSYGNITIGETGRLTLAESARLTINDGSAYLHNSGVILNMGNLGSFVGRFRNSGTIHNQMPGTVVTNGSFENGPTGFIANNSEIRVDYGVFENRGVIHNDSLVGVYGISTQGAIDNMGLLHNRMDGVFYNGFYGGALDNRGMFMNDGSFENLSGDSTLAHPGGELSNTGIVVSRAGADFQNYGELINDGTFLTETGGTLTDGGPYSWPAGLVNNAVWENSGEVEVGGTSGSVVFNEGDLINNSDGDVQIDLWSSLVNNMNTVNTGTIGNDGEIVNTGTFLNSGSLDNGSYLRNVIGGWMVNDTTGLLLSSGEIQNFEQFDNRGLLTNNQTVRNYAEGTNTSWGILPDDAVINNLSTGWVANNDEILNDGLITNASGGVFDPPGTITGNPVLDLCDSVHTVNTTSDTDDGVCDSIHCSLREAVAAANARPGLDSVTFDIGGTGPHSLLLTSPLPAIAGPAVIDGSTQPGYSGSPVILLDGSSAGSGAGGLVLEGNVTVRGLALSGFEGDGVRVDGSADAVTGNTISNNAGNGVTVATGSQNRILSNEIFANGGLGIDLGNEGVTPDDSDDSDTGPNEFQNYPVLDSVSVMSDSIYIEGSLTSTSDMHFDIEFYASEECDSSGFGEGQTFIGSTTVWTLPPGHLAWFRVGFPAEGLQGRIITATATDEAGNTSEFCECYSTASSGIVSPKPEGPVEYALHQNTPNPFSPSTCIRFDLPEERHVNIGVYDLRGRLVATLADGNRKAGRFAVVWNGRNDFGERVSPGIYILCMKAGRFRETRKVTLIK